MVMGLTNGSRRFLHMSCSFCRIIRPVAYTLAIVYGDRGAAESSAQGLVLYLLRSKWELQFFDRLSHIPTHCVID